MNIEYKISDLGLLTDYLNLYKRCFKNFNKDINYFNWLYKKNPTGNYLGIDAFHNNKLIGQVGGIPLNFKFYNNYIKTLVSINVCVDEQYRGNKLFLNLSKNLEKFLMEENFELIIAIGNKQATPAWKKSINLKYLTQLKSYLGFYNFSKIETNLANYNLYMEWSENLINWRCLNPLNETRIINYKNKNLIQAATGIPFTKVYSNFPINFSNQQPSVNFDLNLKIYIGLTNEINSNFLFRKIPENLKPSPLNFLYKFLKKDYDLKEKEVLFSFLDFDAF